MKKTLIITGVVIASVVSAGFIARIIGDKWRAMGYAAYEVCTLDEERKRNKELKDEAARGYYRDDKEYYDWMDHVSDYCTLFVQSQGYYTGPKPRKRSAKWNASWLS